MTAAGLGLNKFCYAGLIAAHKNKIPLTDDTASKVVIRCFHFLWLDSYSLTYKTGFSNISLSWKRSSSLLSSQRGGHQLKHQETWPKM